MYRRAVGSPFAEAILPFFRQIAGPLDLEVIPLRVVAPPPRLPIEGPQRVFTRELEKPGETEPRQVGNDNGAAERHRSAAVP